VKTFVASIAHDHDLMDVAAAAVAMLYEGGAQDEESPSEPEPERPRRDDRGAGRGPRARGEERDRPAAGPMAVLRIGAGRNAGIRPGDLVGAIAGEAQIDSREIGAIKIEAAHALVQVPDALADRIVRALKAATLRGKKVDVSRERG
jgi:ATP-dependent RNA helicase DeaD